MTPTSPSEPALRPDPESLHGRIVWEARVERLEQRLEHERGFLRDLHEHVHSLETRIIALENSTDDVS